MAKIVRALLLVAEWALFFFIIWLAPQASKMNQIARCDWLPERARWSHLARSGLPAVSRKKNFPESYIINPLLTKFVRSRCLYISLVLFCDFMDLYFVSVHKHAIKELGQYPAILISHLVNNPYVITGHYEIFFRLDGSWVVSKTTCAWAKTTKKMDKVQLYFQ